MIGMCAHSLSVRLRHVLPCLRLPVIPCSRAMVDLGVGIHPNHSSSSASSLRHRCSGCSFSCWGCCSCSSRCRRRSSLRSSSWLGSSGCKPLLHPLMPSARTHLACCSCVRAIFALPGGTCRSLRKHRLRHQQPCYHRHRTNQYLHILSITADFVSP